MWTAILVTLGYVAVLYLAGWLACRASWLDSHHPRTIRIRCAAVLFYILPFLSLFPPTWTPMAWLPIIRTFILLLPIFSIEVLSNDEGNSRLFAGFNFQFMRNIILGPLAEEVIFRHTLRQLLPFHGPFQYRLINSMLFALAHGHSLIHDRRSEVVMGVVLQVIFTFVFGLYVSGVYLESNGSMSTCFLVHALCNLVGFPDLDWFGQASKQQVIFIIILSLLCILAGNRL